MVAGVICVHDLYNLQAIRSGIQCHALCESRTDPETTRTSLQGTLSQVSGNTIAEVTAAQSNNLTGALISTPHRNPA